MRNAFSSGYIMMQCILFSSFLIAEFLLNNRYFGSGIVRRCVIDGTVALYLLVTVLISYHNISHDTDKFVLGSEVGAVENQMSLYFRD
jgi:hypothetical protein